MKKLLPLALIAALSFSAAGCSDSDSCPDSLLFVELMSDLNSVGPKGTDGYVKLIDISSESAVADCESFVTSLEPIVTKNKGISGDALSSSWDDYKNAGTFCKATLSLLIAAESVNFAINYPNIQENVKNCGGGAIAIAAESAAQLQEQATTLQGWSGILNSAAQVTAQAADATN